MEEKIYLDSLAGEKIKSYVYCLMDPLNKEVFYIGKGNYNRVDSHEIENGDKKKNKRIREISKKGFQPEKFIICHDLDDRTAEIIESLLITMLQTKKELFENINLLNLQGGFHQNDMFLSIDDINARYGSKSIEDVDITHRILCININQTFSAVNKLIGEERRKELYRVTRGNWVRLSKYRAEQVNLVFAEYNGVVRGIYKPEKWIYDYEDEQYKTMSKKDIKKLCFLGEDVTDHEEYRKYMYMNINKKPKTTSRFKYL
jgi:hypothetical protein